MSTYETFLAGKRKLPPSSGLNVEAGDVEPSLFDFQRHIVAWAVRRGRAAVWADTGLGKTRMQVEWLRQVLAPDERGIILAPLGVTAQTIREAAAIGVPVTYVRNADEVEQAESSIVITNYERLASFKHEVFTAVVLDESSILKAFSGVTKRALVESFAETRYRMACSATPAPNDIEELCNHADFLGIMSPQEMRSTFFIADSRGEFMKYRLKGHAAGAFYQWLASWAVACRTPSDLGFDGSAYVLPPLSIVDHLVPTDWAPEGALFAVGLNGITERTQVRRDTLQSRIDAALDLIRAEPDEQWIVWAGLNDESTAMAAGAAAIVAGPVTEVKGSDDPDDKSAALAAFAFGETQVLVTKAKIAAHGLNFQSCARMIFVGLGDSYEQYYQAIRRCYRFGQARPVHAHVVVADVEAPIVANVRAKERVALDTTIGLVAAISTENRRELFAGTSRGDSYEPSRSLTIPSWLVTEEIQ